MTWLLALLPAPWLLALKKVPWRLIGYCVGAAVAIWAVLLVNGWRVDSNALDGVRADLAAEQACKPKTTCEARDIRAQAAGIAAVAKARRAAAEAATAQQAKLAADAQVQINHVASEAQAATVRAQRWETRYRESLKTPACQAWASAPVPCAISE